MVIVSSLVLVLIPFRGGHLHIVEYLITEEQCDPESRDNYGETPLHDACK